MKNLKVVDQQSLKDWAKEIFQKNSFNMVDVSSKKRNFQKSISFRENLCRQRSI